jgi:hypothetical protein
MSSDSSPIRILVVDDHQLIRVSISTLLQEFAVDFATAGIFRGQSPDQGSDFQCHFGPSATRPGTPADSERRATPDDHGLGFHDGQSVRPSRPNPLQKDPDRAPCLPWRLAVLLGRTLLVAFCIVLSSCQSHRADTAPSVEFSRIPAAAQGGRESVDTIAGRVQNARPGQQIVIFAHSGTWWVQPWLPYLGS